MQSDQRQFSSPVGAYEFMNSFRALPTPGTEYNAYKVGQLDSWNMLQTPMVPVSVEGLPASSGGLVNYSPLAPFVSVGQQMVNERIQFVREMSDTRRNF